MLFPLSGDMQKCFHQRWKLALVLVLRPRRLGKSADDYRFNLLYKHFKHIGRQKLKARREKSYGIYFSRQRNHIFKTQIANTIPSVWGYAKTRPKGRLALAFVLRPRRLRQVC